MHVLIKKVCMPKLKVKPLEWYMQEDPEDLAEQGYVSLPWDFKLIGRDGYYCRGLDVWFEFKGRGYWAYTLATKQKAREYFCYTLTVNDEAILPQREVTAMREVLKITRDSVVRRAIRNRLQLHEQAQDLRRTGREARLCRMRILGY